MRRLWIRISMVMGGLILSIMILSLIAFTLLSTPSFRDYLPGQPAADIAQSRPELPSSRHPEKPRLSPWHEIPENLPGAILLSSIVGLAGGAVASWFMVAPITKLVDAAQAIGAGNLTARVELPRSSQEIDELAEAFNAMAADLQRALETRNNLLADISHELRTPLTVLEGNLRAALDQVVELDDERIANLYSQTDHLIQLVNDLRELTLVEADQLPLDRQPTDIAQLTQEILTVFEPLAEEENITLTLDHAQPLPLVNVDKARLRQVLYNLLANALYYTSAGGTVTVSIHANPEDVQIAIQDSGEGIAPEHLEHLFDRFYRTDPSRSRKSGGSGLGLAIVKAMVKAHGGTVSADSGGKDQGSEFVVALPIM